MAEITSRSAFAPRLPWRTIAVALVIIALLVGAAVVYIGTQQTRLPAPVRTGGQRPDPVRVRTATSTSVTWRRASPACS